MEVFIRLLQTAQIKKKGIIGFKITPRAEKNPLPSFADDYLLFCITNFESCQQFSDLLDKFCRTSGQMINFHISSLLFSKNASARDRQLAFLVFNIQVTTLASILDAQCLGANQTQKCFQN